MRTTKHSLLESARLIRQFQKDPITLMDTLSQQGDLVELDLCAKKLYFCFHPALARQVLSEKAEDFRKSRLIFGKIRPLTGPRGLVQLEGQLGRAHRKITGASVSAPAIEAAIPSFRASALSACSELEAAAESGTEVELSSIVSRITLRNALTLVAGDCPADLAEALSSRFLEINQACGASIRRFSPFPRFSASRAVRELDAMLERLIRHQRPSQGTDLLSVMRRCPFHNDQAQMRDHLATYLFAGYETTATSILMALYCLATHPTVSCDENAYLESLRLFPPSWTLAREATRNTELAERSIRKGSLLFIGIPQLHRRPDFWKDPAAFRPARFNERLSDAYAFLPFGGGARICVGMRAAQVEAKVVLEALSSRYIFEFEPGYSPRLQALITAHPVDGLHARVRKKEDIMTSITQLVERVRQLTPTRRAELFCRFLPEGYQMTTLSSVPSEHRKIVVDAKVRLGTLITLYDDLADNPQCRDKALLVRLYTLPFRVPPRRPACALEILVRDLWKELMREIESFPNFSVLDEAFEFDLRQFYNANQYAELITDFPELGNGVENRAYAPHNMGIMLAGTIDLMASPMLHVEELGRIRALLHHAQVAARLMNVLATHDREEAECDVTSELHARGCSPAELECESDRIFSKLERAAPPIKTFDAMAYVEGLRSLRRLHEQMRGIL